jgi:hypothetical protein
MAIYQKNPTSRAVTIPMHFENISEKKRREEIELNIVIRNKIIYSIVLYFLSPRK